jgi:hypothetical protein
MDNLTREQHSMLRRFALRLSVKEYGFMRDLGFTAEQAADHAIAIAQDFKEIAHGA